MTTSIVVFWAPDNFSTVVDKPKRVRCLDDEINGEINIIPRARREAGALICKACGKKTTVPTKLCTREKCASARGDA